MAQGNISGPGIGLPLPQYLYPSELYNAPLDISTNFIGIAAGDAIPVPASSRQMLIDLGKFCVLQFPDPVTGIWRSWRPDRPGPVTVFSNGFNLRIANLTGCPVAAVVAGGGTGFTQATATITASAGGSTWQPIVGGSLGLNAITATGSSYTTPPFVFIPAPPNPGIQATAYAVITSGTVSAVSFTNNGAGYLTAPSIVLLPNPTDPNFGSIVQATATVSLTNSGAITGALCTNNGAPLTNLTGLTLTAAGGAGSGATITGVVMQTVVGTTIAAGGLSLGTAAVPAGVLSVGGLPVSVSAIHNPGVELTDFRPRSFQASATCSAAGAVTSLTTYDSGLFVGTPTPVMTLGAITGTGSPSMATVTFTMGSTVDTILLQPF